jgi:glutamate/tyrosine decarboxylase-like PLP-dependent enzyme
VNGSALPVAVLADFLASAMNPNCTQHQCAPVHVEAQTLAWLKEMLDFPADAGAVLVSGASMANLIGLAVARHARAGVDVRRDGIAAAGPCTFYATAEAHSSIQRAVEILGFGSRALTLIPTDEAGRMRAPALLARVRKDKARGLRPIAAVATAGTVNIGAVDPLDDIARICADEGLWLHVDGAFGALAWLDPRCRKTLKGLQKADSLAFDAHKWLYQPYDVACIFVRDAELHRAAFRMSPAYLANRTPVSDGPIVFSDYGVELSRRFRALKLWMSLRVHGVEGFARAIAVNLDQARYLGHLVADEPQLELLAPVVLNIVCFRFVGGTSEPDNDRLNQAILTELHIKGLAVPSSTLIGGRMAIRAAITNHRSARSDFDALVRHVVEIGTRLSATGRREVRPKA